MHFRRCGDTSACTNHFYILKMIIFNKIFFLFFLGKFQKIINKLIKKQEKNRKNTKKISKHHQKITNTCSNVKNEKIQYIFIDKTQREKYKDVKINNKKQKKCLKNIFKI